MNGSKYIINIQTKEDRDSRSEAIYRSIICFCFALFIALTQFVYFLNGTNGNSARMGAYLLMVITGILAVTMSVFYGGKLTIPLSLFQLYIFLFPIYCLITSFFAYSPSLSRMRSIDLLEMSVVYLVFSMAWEEQKDDIDSLLAVIMIANYITVVYALLSNGLDRYLSLMESNERIDNGSINANTLGMTCAYAIIIHIYFIHRKKYLWFIPLLFLAGLSLLISQSRKAIIMIVIGLIIISVTYNFDPRKPFSSFFRVLIILVALSMLFVTVVQLPVFDGFRGRLENMITGFFGEETKEGSFNTRMRMKDIGWEIFFEHPIIGIGLDNAGLICGPYYHMSYFYLHDNYIEILADTGVVGFGLYYFIYAVILIRMIRYRSLSNKEYGICLAILAIHLMMDYGCITWMDKYDWFFLFVLWMESEKLKRNHSKIRSDKIRCKYWKNGTEGLEDS